MEWLYLGAETCLRSGASVGELRTEHGPAEVQSHTSHVGFPFPLLPEATLQAVISESGKILVTSLNSAQ